MIRNYSISYFVGGHCWTPPIVQIVLQIAVANAELQRLKKLLVLHEIKRIEHIETHLLHTTYASTFL